ncbi:Aste57867_24762 [Aphanomyces stellatus]|uniref:Aste57867_24762 protein n=1 Tax=Aphanomyces stellatus TaxID=120398 RepID=A0A485LRA3_9STRA|nr:hypothetical protein As57867_024684 [Aphanomyces stellatus]VFU01398.1 Aste57867_24762 [Aphanomyces stellatus]
MEPIVCGVDELDVVLAEVCLDVESAEKDAENMQGDDIANVLSPKSELVARRKSFAMSARNSSFWLQVVAQSHSDLSLQSSSPSLIRTFSLDENLLERVHQPFTSVCEDVPAPEDVVVYEHERYQILLGWGAKGCLLPLDPKKYTDATYSAHYPVFPTIALPHSTNDGSWEWTTPWRIHVSDDTDKDDDSHLDRKSGWLFKLGHVRKNWKRRYFVLDGSVLRYFSEDIDSVTHKSKTHKLKGEVLLFHKDTTVHYVDIHLSGRDFTFAIEAGEYSLLLQANSLDDREDWIYAIEDAILCRDSYVQDDSASNSRLNVEKRRSLTRVVTQPKQAEAICQRIVKAHSENIKNFVTTFLHHYEKKTERDESRALSALKSYRMFVERILAKVLERYREYLVQNKQDHEMEHTYADARDIALLAIERLTFIPLQDAIYNLLVASTGEDSINVFEKKRRWLAKQPQAFFDIQPSHT